MAMHMHVRARVYARGWTSAGRGGNPSVAGLVCRPRSARGGRRAATRARMSLEVPALYSHKPAAVLVCSWRCNCHIEQPRVYGPAARARRYGPVPTSIVVQVNCNLTTRRIANSLSTWHNALGVTGCLNEHKCCTKTVVCVSNCVELVFSVHDVQCWLQSTTFGGYWEYSPHSCRHSTAGA